MKIMAVVGARPQFIKFLPLQEQLLRTASQKMSYKLIHTGQHYDYEMSKIFFDELGLKEPDYFLEVGSGPHGEQTGKILTRCEKIYLKERPDVVIVFGDTNSTLGAALAASKLNIPVAHVEAGLRSFDKYMPEEQNRILTDHISSLLFCPSQTAIQNLKREGFSIHLGGELVPLNIHFENMMPVNVNNPLVLNVGDIMYDAIVSILKNIRDEETVLEKYHVLPNSFYLVTIHRAENTDDIKRFAEIVDFINTHTEGENVVFPVHPRTAKIVKSSDVRFHHKVRLTEPIGYKDLLVLLKNAKMVFTDSGGIQKEAFWVKTPCVTLRDETEWVETVELGWNVLFRDFSGSHGEKMSDRHPYGDGRAAERMVEIIKRVPLGQ